jgi:hypothetical protein
MNSIDRQIGTAAPIVLPCIKSGTPIERDGHAQKQPFLT